MCRNCLSWYGRHIAPRLVHAGCSATAFVQMRRRMIPLARGVVVEVGFGSGLNIPHYHPTKVERLIGVEPDPVMLAMATSLQPIQPFPVELIEARGESLPLTDRLADTAVVTYALCTIAEPLAALAEVRRILKPDGRLIFIEHGQAPDTGCRRWQQRLNRPWSCLAGGCRLDRDPLRLLQQAGFRLLEQKLGRFPLCFWPLGSHHAGIAVPPAG